MNPFTTLYSCFLVFTICLHTSFALQAQCNEHPVPQSICQMAPGLCIAGQCYINWDDTPDPHPNWCGGNTTVSNAQYLALVASDTEISVTIYVDTCYSQPGMSGGLQCGLIDTCEWTNSNVIDCMAIPRGGAGTIEILNAIPGKTYWLIADGLVDQVCQYTIVELQGVVQSDVNGVSAVFDFATEGPVVTFTNLSENASAVSWDFGDGTFSEEWNPEHQYETSGVYTVYLIAFNACGADTTVAIVEAQGTGVWDFTLKPQVDVLPNPNNGSFRLLTDLPATSVELYDLFGRHVPMTRVDDNLTLDGNAPGIYMLVVRQDLETSVKRIVVR